MILMHRHNQDPIVRAILTTIAKEEKKPFKKVKKLFAFKGNLHITHRVGELLNQHYPNHTYSDVFHCPGCDQFDLE